MKSSDKLKSLREAADRHHDTTGDFTPLNIVMMAEDNAAESGLDSDSEEYAVHAISAIEGSIAPRGDYGQYGELFAKWGF